MRPQRMRDRLLPGRREVVLSARIEYDQHSSNQKGMHLSEKEWEASDMGGRLRKDVEEVINCQGTPTFPQLVDTQIPASSPRGARCWGAGW